MPELWKQWLSLRGVECCHLMLGFPDHPVWMLMHPHAKSLIESQTGSFTEGFINKITVALLICPRSSTSKLQMQGQGHLRKSEAQLWFCNVTAKKKNKRLKSCFLRWFSRKKKCTDKFQVKTGIWFYLYLQQIHRQYK